MPPRRGDALREAVTQVMYAASGDKEQYTQTIDAVMGAVETYISQMTLAALRLGKAPDKVQAGDVIEALSCDSMLHRHMEKQYESWQEITKLRKETNRQMSGV